MQLKISVLGAILAASSSVLAAPTSLLSPDSAITAVTVLTTQTKHIYSQIEDLKDAATYTRIVGEGLARLLEMKIDDNNEFGFVGTVEGAVGFTTFSQKQEQELCDSIASFVNADTTFLRRLIALKEDIYGISGELYSDKTETDTLLNALINYAPSCADDVTYEIQNLADVEKEAIKAYGGSSLLE